MEIGEGIALAKMPVAPWERRADHWRLFAVIGGRLQSLTPESERRNCANSYLQSLMDLPRKIQQTSHVLTSLPSKKYRVQIKV